MASNRSNGADDRDLWSPGGGIAVRRERAALSNSLDGQNYLPINGNPPGSRFAAKARLLAAGLSPRACGPSNAPLAWPEGALISGHTDDGSGARLQLEVGSSGEETFHVQSSACGAGRLRAPPYIVRFVFVEPSPVYLTVFTLVFPPPPRLPRVLSTVSPPFPPYFTSPD